MTLKIIQLKSIPTSELPEVQSRLQKLKGFIRKYSTFIGLFVLASFVVPILIITIAHLHGRLSTYTDSPSLTDSVRSARHYIQVMHSPGPNAEYRLECINIPGRNYSTCTYRLGPNSWDVRQTNCYGVHGCASY